MRNIVYCSPLLLMNQKRTILPVFTDRQLRDHARSLEKKGRLFRHQKSIHGGGSLKFWVHKVGAVLFKPDVMNEFRDFKLAAKCHVYFHGLKDGNVEELAARWKKEWEWTQY